MAHRFHRPLPGRLGRSQTTVDPTRTRWVEVPVSRTFRENVRQRLQASSDDEEEERGQEPPPVDQEPDPFDRPGQRPWEFPSRPVLRLSQPRELAHLWAPNDVSVQALERMKNREGFKRYVNYPTRLFHLRPQSNLRIPDDLDWETTFLWHKVSNTHCRAAWIREFPYPGLDLPLLSFPEAILRRGSSMRVSKTHAREALEFAAAVLESSGRGPSDPVPDPTVQWRDIRSMAKGIVGQLDRRSYREAPAMAAKMRDNQRAMKDYDSFFRFRDSGRRPMGMGFRGTRDTFFLDDDYITDFLNRASQNGAVSLRMRSDVRLIPFLNSLDAAKVTDLAVSAQAFREPKVRMYLCYAIARTFPNLKWLRLTSIGTVDNDTARRWEITPRRWFLFADLQEMADEEMRRNGGSSFLRAPREDAQALFDLSNMSSPLIEATGTNADGRGRVLTGEPSRTPLVAFGIRSGLLHDPEPGVDEIPTDQGGQDPPFVAVVQHMLMAAFRVIIRRREAAAKATRAEALAKLEGRRTMLPRPVRRGTAWGPRSADRLYRRSEANPPDFLWWAQDHSARECRRGALEDVSSETDPDSEPSVPAVDVGPYTRQYARVEASVLVYDRESFDKNVHGGWTGFGPGVDLSHFRHI